MFSKIYYTSFYDINENKIDVEIYKDTTATAKELTCTEDAVQINYESDSDIYKALKCSDMQLNIYTDEVLEDLYTAKNDTYCIIKKNGGIIWYGFSTACLYQSDYVTNMDALSLQFNDIISSLESVKYSYFNDNVPVSFYRVIKYILQKIDKAGIIQHIYLHNAMSLNGSVDLLNNLYISERNFFDEEGEAENCKNILEYIAKYLNCTCLYSDDSIYLINYDSLSSIKSFTTYNLVDDTTSSRTISDAIINVNDCIYQSNGSISINDQYNKVVVIANTNSADTTLPEIFENLVNENADQNKYYESTQTIDDKNYTILNAFFKPNENYETNRPDVAEITPSNVTNTGSYFQKVDYYESDKEPSSLNWTTYLTAYNGSLFVTDFPIIKLIKDSYFIGKGGVLIVDLKYKLSGDWNAAGCIKTSDELFKTTQYGTGYEDTRFKARLKIGDYYYDGEQWTNYSEYLDKLNGGYYKTLFYSQRTGAKWYKYKNTKGWWIYCTESEYNAATTEKASGDCIPNKMYAFKNSNDENVWVELSYYYECELKDSFYLVHKNKEDEKCFDTECQLTNTVSWRMNLANSEDGVAIKLPVNMILSGNIEFTLSTPNMLGTYPCYRTDSECHLCKAVHISDFKMKYTTSDSVVDIFDMDTYESDIKYENVIDDEIVRSMDDIEMRVNTYNSNSVSYSYVITYRNSSIDYVDRLLDIKSNETLKSEEHYIRRYVNYYSQMKYNYSNHLVNCGIKPYRVFYESTLDKEFVLSSVTFNLVTDSAEITLKQI